MAPRYKLTYFDLRGRAEPTRIALAYAGVDYDDVRVSFENRFEGEWSEIKNSGKFPFGTVPILEVDGETLSQSMAILRFVARRHGLAPSEDIQQARAEMFAEEVYSLENAFIRALSSNDLSFADICVFAFFNTYLGHGEPAVPAALEKFPRLRVLYEKVRDEPRIEEWLKKRPKTSL
ncbi:hematopoietic prostaglandin D synthase-like isoform X2 [Acropora muricata]|uniref:hematopoietic prostaglandin D synthase-like isoform X2 n=1 Tax=Acropora muricata TaxID=159855 RepID=UPI0034E54570